MAQVVLHSGLQVHQCRLKVEYPQEEERALPDLEMTESLHLCIFA